MVYAVLAYASWGALPLYWKPFGAGTALEVACHRALGSLLVLIVLVMALRQAGELRHVLHEWRELGVLVITALLLSANWLLFIHAVNAGQVVEASLGFFLMPLVSIVLGLVFLRERLRPWQVVAVVLAAAGVLHYGWHLGRVPWLALTLAVSFAVYALLRKVVPVSPLVGLLIEAAVVAPFAVGTLAWLTARGETLFGASGPLTGLFLGAGAITTLPLIWFNNATKLLPLSTMGFLQYLEPTIALLIAVLIFREAFSARDAVSFGLIWIAIALYLGTLFSSASHHGGRGRRSVPRLSFP